MNIITDVFDRDFTFLNDCHFFILTSDKHFEWKNMPPNSILLHSKKLKYMHSKGITFDNTIFITDDANDEENFEIVSPSLSDMQLKTLIDERLRKYYKTRDLSAPISFVPPVSYDTLLNF